MGIFALLLILSSTTLHAQPEVNSPNTLGDAMKELLSPMKNACSRHSNDAGLCPLVALTVSNHIGRFCKDYNYDTEEKCANARYSDFTEWLLKNSKASL